MFKSIYQVITKEEFEQAADPSYSYFPCVSPGKDPESGKSIEVINHYAKHKYILVED